MVPETVKPLHRRAAREQHAQEELRRDRPGDREGVRAGRGRPRRRHQPGGARGTGPRWRRAHGPGWRHRTGHGSCAISRTRSTHEPTTSPPPRRGHRPAGHPGQGAGRTGVRALPPRRGPDHGAGSGRRVPGARPVQLRAVAPGRRRRADHVMADAVPRPGTRGRARPGRGLPGRAQARRVGAAAGRAAGGDHHRGEPARRRAQHRARLPPPQSPRHPGAGRPDRPPQRGAAVVRGRRRHRAAGHAETPPRTTRACRPNSPATRPASSSPTPTWTRRSTARCSAPSR